ncbi:MAG: hypothetical protein WCB19_10870 [Thermoplasmata archaeon]
MSQPPEAGAKPGSKRRRRAILVIVTVAIIAGVLLAMVFVPYNSTSKEIQVSAGTSATATLSIPEAGWVTVHFDHPSGMAMQYWMCSGSPGSRCMQGSSGMMFDHSMMEGSDSYSFWTWGGTYQCGAGYTGSGYGMIPVWVNASWGML